MPPTKDDEPSDAPTPENEIREAFRRLSQTQLPMAPDEPENAKKS